MTDAPKRNPAAVRFGKNLLRYRRARGFSQEDVAARASLHRTEIGLLERGQRTPRIDTVAKLAAAVVIPPGDLFDGIVWELPTTNEGRMRVRPSEED